MFIVVKSVVDVKIPQPSHGKTLAKLASQCLTDNLDLTFDFEGIETVTHGFSRELFLPLVLEFGAEILKTKLQLINLAPDVSATINNSFAKLDQYFDQLSNAPDVNCDEEIYELNLFWLVKARDMARNNAVNAQLIMGIAEEEMRLALSKLTIEDIHRIAKCGWLCFSPRFSSRIIQDISRREFDSGEILLALSGSMC